VIMEKDASCLFHPDKMAKEVCAGCGAYLCGLCDFRIDDTHLCPKCLEAKKDHAPSLRKQSVLYDEVCLIASVLSTLTIWPSIFTAIPVIVFSLMKWGKVVTPYPRGKWRFVAAMVISSLQIVGWSAVVVMVIR